MTESHTPTISDEEFRAAIQRTLKIVSVAELGDYLWVSLPTIRRWTEGKNLPMRHMREAIMKVIKKLRTPLDDIVDALE